MCVCVCVCVVVQLYPVACFYGASQVVTLRSSIVAPTPVVTTPSIVSPCGRFGVLSYVSATVPLPDMAPRHPATTAGPAAPPTVVPPVMSTTAARVPSPAASGSWWTCAACTYVNSPDATTCQICSSAPSDGRQWMCPVCTYLNGFGDSKCTMCSSDRPADAVPVSAPPPTTTVDPEEELLRALSLSMSEPTTKPPAVDLAGS